MAVLSVPLAKSHLNISSGNYDAELLLFIDAAEAAIAGRVGPLASTAVTARVYPVGYAMALPVSPAISLTSVTPALGAALTLADLHLNTTTAVVTFNDGRCFTERYYDVVYAAGRASVPAHLLLAVKELLRHMWFTQRGGSVRPASPQAETVPGSAYTFPTCVEQLLALDPQSGMA